MNFSKRVIHGKSNYSEDIYCKTGDSITDKTCILLGFKDNLPVLSPTSSEQYKKTLKVHVDPATGEKFIILNGKRLKIVSEAMLPSHLQRNTPNKNVENNAVLGSSPKSAPFIGAPIKIIVPPVKLKVLQYKNKALQPLSELRKYGSSSSGSTSSDETTNKTDNLMISSRSLSKKLVIKKSDSKILHKDNINGLKSADNVISTGTVTVDNVKCSSEDEGNADVTLFDQKTTEIKAKMQALDLTKQIEKQIVDNASQTEDKAFVDMEVQTEKTLVLDLFDSEFDVDKLFNDLEPTPITQPNQIVNSQEGTFVTNTATKTQQRSLKFLNELNSALVPDEQGNMPIHVGVLLNDLKLVKRRCLILKTLKEPVDIPNNSEFTALQLALIHDSSVEIISWLLSKGADLNVTDVDGNTIIHLAVEYERLDALRILLDHADSMQTCLDQFNHEGLTPLMICCQTGQSDCAELLLEYESDPNMRDLIAGKVPLFHAAERHDLNMVKLLLTFQADTKVKNFFGTSPHDAMYEVDEIPETIKAIILGRHGKRKLFEEFKANKARKLEEKKEKRKQQTFQKIRTYPPKMPIALKGEPQN